MPSLRDYKISLKRSPPTLIASRSRLRQLQRAYSAGRVAAPQIRASLISWMGHASHANSFRLVRRLLREYKFLRPKKRPTEEGQAESP